MTVIKKGWLHKKSLGFASPTSTLLVDLASVRASSKRYFVLADRRGRGGGGHVELRYYAGETVEPSERAVNEELDVLARTPELGLKFVMIIDAQTLLSEHRGVVALCSRERTLILASLEEEGADGMQEWYRAIEGFVRSSRTSQAASAVPSEEAPPPPAAADASPLRSIETILADKPLREKFRSFVKYAFAQENLDFIESVERLELAIALDPESPETLAAARETFERYVSDTASDQVNLSSEQRRQITQAMSEARPDMVVVQFAIQSAKREILELLRRNFLAKFATKERDNAERLRQRELLSGCFSSLWSLHGLDAYLSVLDHFGPVASDGRVMTEYFTRRISRANEEAEANRVLSNAFRGGFNLPQLKTLSRAMRSILETLELHTKTLGEFARELFDTVLDPMVELQKSMDASVRRVAEAHRGRVEAILDARDAARRAQAAEATGIAHISALREIHAELASQGKKKEKEAKKAQGILETAVADLDRLAAARTDAEIAMVSAESASANEFLGALDELQSCALHRIDTFQDLLSRSVLSEQQRLNKLVLRLSAALEECNDIDSIGDLVALAGSVGSVALTTRRQSVHQERPSNNNNVVVPVATAAARGGSFTRLTMTRAGSTQAFIPTAERVLR